MKASKPDFRRQESWRYKRLAENWRRPRGVTSKMRKEESGAPPKVKAGYGSKASTRGLHPRGLVDMLVWREADLDKLDPKIHIVRIARRVGEKKRLGIVDKAKQHNFHIANPGKEESRPIPEVATEEEKALPETVEEEKTATAKESGEEEMEEVEDAESEAEATEAEEDSD